MNFQYNCRNGNHEIIYCAESGKSLDREIYSMLKAQENILPVMPMSLQQNGDMQMIHYDIFNKTNMLAWWDMAGEEARRNMQNQIEQAVVGLIRRGIPDIMILQDKHYMYVDQETGRVALVCIPFKENKEPGLPLVPPVPSDDSLDYLPPAGTGHEMEFPGNVVENNDHITHVEIIKDENGQEQLYTPVDSHIGDDIPDAAPVRPSAPWTETPAIRNNGDHRDKEDQTVLLGHGEEEEDGTIILGSRKPAQGVLKNLRTNTNFPIAKPVCWIGKKQEMVNILVLNNPAVSRRHCAIYFIDGGYYLVDAGSSNHTFYEERQLEPGELVKMEDQSEIMLGDEKFIFIENGEEWL